MGSRYDIAVFRGVTLAQFGQAFREHGVVGAEVERPWAEPPTIAQIDTASGSNVVIVARPMEMVDGANTLLAEKLGAEVLFATVWDTVSSYSLSVVGDGVDRSLYAEPSEEEENAGEIIVDSSGERLPEEPDWPESDLSEAYVQYVFQARCGIDPGNLYDYDTTWYALGSQPDPEQPPMEPQQPPTASQNTERTPPAEPTAVQSGGLWSRVKRLFG